MASLVEIHDLTPAAQFNLLQDSECCDVQALDTIMGFEPLPTPPLSPEHINSSPPSPATSLPYTIESCDASMDDNHAEALLNQMLQCEHIPAFEDTDSFPDSQASYASSNSPSDDLSDVIIDVGADLLIQDCMWNSHTYEPRSLFGNVNGVYTPAPSPPPPSSDKADENDKVDENDEQNDEQNSLKEDTTDIATSDCSSRHTQAMSSESEEEIDVVTVTERIPTRMSTRKQRHFSVSAPCSRQSSPTPPSPKKRKYHAKRLQRISSTCSSVGDGTESDDEHRRASHNILERKRRNDLKFSFQVLRAQVPELEENQRAPKVTILRKAAEYIRRIQIEGNAMEQELEKEKKREAKLRQRLALLKAMQVAC